MPPTDNIFHRVAIEGIKPQVDAGRFAVKRVVGDEVVVEANAFADGHEELVAILQYQHVAPAQSVANNKKSPATDSWTELPLEPQGNDEWRTSFRVENLGIYRYRVVAWIDRFHTWQHDLKKRSDAGQNLQVDLLIGAELVEAVAKRAAGADAKQLAEFAAQIAAAKKHASLDQAARFSTAMSDPLLQLMDRYADRSLATVSPELEIVVDDRRAEFSAWYELFPRSCSPTAGKHGTFRDLIAHLPYVSSMGSTFCTCRPIHPLGRAFRKGKNNQEKCEPGDVGSAWAIGGPEGGHKAVHPELGKLEDFNALVAAAREQKLEIALDIAFQCFPPTIHTPKNILSGSGTVPTARFNMPRILRRNIRTYIRSISNATIGAPCGKN